MVTILTPSSRIITSKYEADSIKRHDAGVANLGRFRFNVKISVTAQHKSVDCTFSLIATCFAVVEAKHFLRVNGMQLIIKRATFN